MSTHDPEDGRRFDADAVRTSDGGWAIGIALVVFGAGILLGSPLLVALAVIPLGFVAAAGFDSAPTASITTERELRLATADEGAHGSEDEDGLSGGPGERVVVSLAVRNDDTDPLVDLRVRDQVPDTLPVVDGNAEACFTLGADETQVLEYTVELQRGEHRFGGVDIRARGAGSTETRTQTLSVDGDSRLTCFTTVDDVPINEGDNDLAGEIPTDDGGSGVEFYSVRDYEPGDPVRSIDWRRYANTRELATIEFRAERATKVVCLIDQRPNQRRRPSDDHLTGLSLSVAAAEQTFETILDSGYPAGLVGFKERLLVTVDPGTDDKTKRMGRDVLASMRSAAEGFDERAQTRWGQPLSSLPSTLPGEAQVILFSTFTDSTPVDLVEQLRVHGYSVCVVSPDVASGRTDAAGRLTAVHRRTRLAEARLQGARVVDWDLGQPLGLVLDRVVSEVSSR